MGWKTGRCTVGLDVSHLARRYARVHGGARRELGMPGGSAPGKTRMKLVTLQADGCLGHGGRWRSKCGQGVGSLAMATGV